MKKMLSMFFVLTVATVMAAPTLDLYPVQKNRSAVIGGAIVERPDATVILLILLFLNGSSSVTTVQ